MTNALVELRQTGQGATPAAESLARNIEMRLNELVATVNQAINRVEKSGIQQPAPTVVGRLEQARRWLEQPGADDRDLGRQAIHLVVDEGHKVSLSLFCLFVKKRYDLQILILIRLLMYYLDR